MLFLLVQSCIPVNIRHRANSNNSQAAEAKIEAGRAINRALEAGWPGLPIAERFRLDDIAKAHEFVEHPKVSGRVVVVI